MRPFFEFRSFCICTGLNVEVDRILEIACIITDGNLTKTLEVYSLFFFGQQYIPYLMIHGVATLVFLSLSCAMAL